MARNKVLLADGTVLIDLTQDDVVESDVASGKKFHKADGTTATGTSTFDADTSDATAVASEIIEGKMAYKAGARVVGTMPNRGAQTIRITDKNTPINIQNGYHDGSGNAAIDDTEKAKLIPANIKSGIEILGVTGDYSGEGAKAQSKTATPYLTAQTLLPDAGYDYISQVTIAAIPIVETDNAAGGKTVTIGAVAPA